MEKSQGCQKKKTKKIFVQFSVGIYVIFKALPPRPLPTKSVVDLGSANGF